MDRRRNSFESGEKFGWLWVLGNWTLSTCKYSGSRLLCWNLSQWRWRSPTWTSLGLFIRENSKQNQGQSWLRFHRWIGGLLEANQIWIRKILGMGEHLLQYWRTLWSGRKIYCWWKVHSSMWRRPLRRWRHSPLPNWKQMETRNFGPSLVGTRWQRLHLLDQK